MSAPGSAESFLDAVLAQAEEALAEGHDLHPGLMVDLYVIRTRHLAAVLGEYVDAHNRFVRRCHDLRGTLHHLAGDPGVSPEQRELIDRVRNALRDVMEEAYANMRGEMRMVVRDVVRIARGVRAF